MSVWDNYKPVRENKIVLSSTNLSLSRAFFRVFNTISVSGPLYDTSLNSCMSSRSKMAKRAIFPKHVCESSLIPPPHSWVAWKVWCPVSDPGRGPSCTSGWVTQTPKKTLSPRSQVLPPRHCECYNWPGKTLKGKLFVTKKKRLQLQHGDLSCGLCGEWQDKPNMIENMCALTHI